MPIITSITLTGLVRHNNTSTIITRKARSNKRVNRTAAVALIPRIISTMSVPIVTTNNVNSKEKVTTTFVLNTRTIRVKAEFIITGRSVIRRGCGREVVGTGSVSSTMAKEARKRPIHYLEGRVAERCGQLRTRKGSFRRLRCLALKALEGTIRRNSAAGKAIVTNRVTNLMAGRRAYGRVVSRVVRRTSGLLNKYRGWKRS